MDRSTRYTTLVALTAALLWAGCSDDPKGNADAGTDQDTAVTDTSADTAADTAADTDDGPDTGGKTDGGSDTGGVADGGDTGDADGGDKPDACLRDEFMGGTTSSCQDNPPPARCNENPGSFGDWGPASAISSLELTSSDAKSKALDLNYADGADNGLAGVLDALSALGTDVDMRIADNIDSGRLLLLLEHQGLEADTSFKVNPLLGRFASSGQTDASVHGTPYRVRPLSFEEGTFPNTQLQNASTKDDFSAGPGRLNLQIELGFFRVSVPIRGAHLQADVGSMTDLGNSSGVALENGRLGGYVLLEDLFGVLNDLYGECTCLDNPSETFVLPDGPGGDDPDLCGDLDSPECEVTCSEDVTMRSNNCSASQDGNLCAGLTGACAVTSTIKGQADLDVDCDGTKDAVSIGAVFEAAGADIQGVAEDVTVDNQSVAATGGEITVKQAFTRDNRWLAVRAIGPNGGIANVMGHSDATLPAGLHSDVTIDMDNASPLQDGWGLWLVVHKDDGNGTFDFDAGDAQPTDGPVMKANGEPLAKRFVISVP